MRQAFLNFLVTVVGRLLLRGDRLSGRMERTLSEFSLNEQRTLISSGGRRLSAVYVSAGEDTPAVLICHGIGELVEYWGRVQVLLQGMGVSSLVFNYSGYGKSSGDFSTTHCEEDAIAAYNELVDRGHQSIVLLGYSLGSGVVCAVASRVDVTGVVLCEAFSSLREGGSAMGFPGWVIRIVPNVWDTAHLAGELEVAVLVVHSDVDDLFPMSMAKRVVEACGARGRLIVVSGLLHNAPIFTPTATYWQPIAEWVQQRPSEDLTEGLPAVRS